MLLNLGTVQSGGGVGGGGVLNLMGRAKVKLGCRVREGGARCQFFKHRGGLQVILIFKWYIIYSN